MKITNEPFPWPLWLLPVIIVVSSITWVVIIGDPLANLRASLCAVGWILIILRYLWGWKRGGSLMDLIIYSLIGLFMPYISDLFVEILRMAVRESSRLAG